MGTIFVHRLCEDNTRQIRLEVVGFGHLSFGGSLEGFPPFAFSRIFPP